MAALDRVKIVGVGDSTLDYLFYSRMTHQGDAVPAVDYSIQGGGLVATALVACARLGAVTELVCRLGSDVTTGMILQGLRIEGVGVDKAVYAPDCRSNVSFVHVDSSTGERTIYYYRDPKLRSARVPGSWALDDADCLLVDDTWLEAAVPAARRAREMGVPVVADMVPSENSAEIVSLVDILIAPATFGRDHASNGDLRPALRRIREMGPSTAVITVGNDGCWYADVDGEGHVPGFKVRVVDTTGAGDVFHGAFAFATSQGWETARRVEFASAVAAIKCGDVGGRKGIPSFGDAVAWLGREGKMNWQAFC